MMRESTLTCNFDSHLLELRLDFIELCPNFFGLMIGNIVIMRKMMLLPDSKNDTTITHAIDLWNDHLY